MVNLKDTSDRRFPVQLYLPLEDIVWLDQQVQSQANGCRSRGAVLHRLIKQAKGV